MTEKLEQNILNSPLWYQIFIKYIVDSKMQPALFMVDIEKKKLAAMFVQDVESNTIHSMSNYYTPEYNFLDSCEQQSSLINNHISLDIQSIKKTKYIQLVPLKDAQLKLFKSIFDSANFLCIPYRHSTNWYEPDIKSVDDYWNKRGSRLKNTIRRKKSKLLKNEQFKIVIPEMTNEKDFYKYLAQYHHVYLKSWKKNEPYPEFIDELYYQAWQREQLVFGFVYHNNCPIASQAWILSSQKAHIYKLAHDPAYTKQSPGSILTAELVNHVILKHNINYIDFLTGDDKYKADWMSCKQQLWGLQCFNKKILTSSFKGYLRYYKNKCKALIISSPIYSNIFSFSSLGKRL
ncbi:GNAT family N-acetyltransferase [Thalassotalea maritima]|uniref:GNAT family N-acetyltransferase n=1 Tax=Thalassotalea maritima TaxID=3242416 RepID=UPI003527CC61